MEKDAKGRGGFILLTLYRSGILLRKTWHEWAETWATAELVHRLSWVVPRQKLQPFYKPLISTGKADRLRPVLNTILSLFRLIPSVLGGYQQVALENLALR
jgi:hypothetical protein